MVISYAALDEDLKGRILQVIDDLELNVEPSRKMENRNFIPVVFLTLERNCLGRMIIVQRRCWIQEMYYQQIHMYSIIPTSL